jgi:hypothetical protein
VEEIAMKKPKTVADLLAVADVCIEASEARARLRESRGKGPARRKDDQEVNTAERGDRKDRRDQGFRGKQSVTPTFYKNKIFVQIGVHIKMHIKL